MIAGKKRERKRVEDKIYGKWRKEEEEEEEDRLLPQDKQILFFHNLLADGTFYIIL